MASSAKECQILLGTLRLSNSIKLDCVNNFAMCFYFISNGLGIIVYNYFDESMINQFL
jgi:hypothetical protein